MTQQEFQKKFGGEIKNGWKERFDKLFGHNSVCSLTGLIEIKSFIHTEIERVKKRRRNVKSSSNQNDQTY